MCPLTSRDAARTEPLALAYSSIEAGDFQMIDNEPFHASSFAIDALGVASEVGIVVDGQQLQLHFFQELAF